MIFDLAGLKFNILSSNFVIRANGYLGKLIFIIVNTKLELTKLMHNLKLFTCFDNQNWMFAEKTEKIFPRSNRSIFFI
jgi:hypothetical protein